MYGEVESDLEASIHRTGHSLTSERAVSRLRTQVVRETKVGLLLSRHASARESKRVIVSAVVNHVFLALTA